MPRILIIEYDDKAVAQDQLIELRPLSKEARALGVFDTPEEFCECGDWVTVRGRPATESTWVKELGLRVCLKCTTPFPALGWIPNLIAPEQVRDPVTHRVSGNELLFFPIALNLTGTKVNR